MQTATRTRRTWKPDPRGYYTRQIGWKLSGTSKRQQHKFILGTDRREAERRDRKLQELWEAFVEGLPEPRPLWSTSVLEVAMEIAKGRTEFLVSKGDDENAMQYARRVELAQLKYPMMIFVPEDRRAFVSGQVLEAKFAAIPSPSWEIPTINFPPEPSPEIMAAALTLKSAGYSIDPALALFLHAGQEDGIPAKSPRLGVLKVRDPVVSLWSDSKSSRSLRGVSEPERIANTEPRTSLTEKTLHEAFASYKQNLQKETFRPESGHVSPWGRTQIRQVHNLAKHHPDRLLSELNADGVSEMTSYWRRRPCKIGSDTPMTSKTCSNYLGTLVRFLKWLDRSSEHQWVKPFAFNDLELRVKTLAGCHVRIASAGRTGIRAPVYEACSCC